MEKHANYFSTAILYYIIVRISFTPLNYKNMTIVLRYRKIVNNKLLHFNIISKLFIRRHIIYSK